MLLEFITAQREILIARARAKVAARLAPRPTEAELLSGVPLFLDQLAATLRQSPASTNEAMERSATLHGAALLGRGYTVAQVVHDYGDLCQVVTELAGELEAPVTTEEFQTLNLCLDNAIADAVTEYARLREHSMVEDETVRSGVFAHELRNRVSTAQLAFHAITSGRAPTGGSVAAIVNRSLQRISALVDRSLVEVRVDSGTAHRQRTKLHYLLEEAELAAALEAVANGISLSVTPSDSAVDVDVDPHILAGALANLLQNAIKFTRPGGRVSLGASVGGGRVRIAIGDECGGLPRGKAEELFGAFQQRGANRGGLGLGLFISRKGVEASSGTLGVEDRPGIGCVFTIDLPQMSPESN
jgi:signal transduction histidine kinase